MGRTATFKSGERYVRPTGLDAPLTEAESNAPDSTNSLFKFVDEKGNPVTTVQSQGEHPLPASTPVEVITDSRELSELDVKADQKDPEFEPTEEELAQFQSLQDGGLSEAEAATEVWPGVEFDLDAEPVTPEGDEEVTGAPEEENSEEESTETVAESEETAPAAEEVAEEPVTPEDEPAWDKSYPQGAPVHAWKVGQIDAWAADQNPVVEFPEGATKDQKLAQIKEG
ncbi:hypothetical protein SEA_RASPUTIA_57 [Microbacterium phage Rasputia]|nr:hypothetical protein SEA_RASPUTIA_57 [Microbacterium phage Rasputia]